MTLEKFDTSRFKSGELRVLHREKLAVDYGYSPNGLFRVHNIMNEQESALSSRALGVSGEEIATKYITSFEYENNDTYYKFTGTVFVFDVDPSISRSPAQFHVCFPGFTTPVNAQNIERMVEMVSRLRSQGLARGGMVTMFSDLAARTSSLHTLVHREWQPVPLLHGIHSLEQYTEVMHTWMKEFKQQMALHHEFGFVLGLSTGGWSAIKTIKREHVLVPAMAVDMPKRGLFPLHAMRNVINSYQIYVAQELAAEIIRIAHDGSDRVRVGPSDVVTTRGKYFLPPDHWLEMNYAGEVHRSIANSGIAKHWTMFVRNGLGARFGALLQRGLTDAEHVSDKKMLYLASQMSTIGEKFVGSVQWFMFLRKMRAGRLSIEALEQRIAEYLNTSLFGAGRNNINVWLSDEGDHRLNNAHSIEGINQSILRLTQLSRDTTATR